MLRPAQVFRLRTHHWDWFIHLPRLKRLVGLWLLFLALAHWIACVWWWIGTSSFNFGYVNVDGEPIYVPGPIFVKYASACGTARLRHDDDARAKQGVLFYPVFGGDDADGDAQYLLPLGLFTRPKLRGKENRALRAHGARLGPTCPTMAMAGDGSDLGASFLSELDAFLEQHELVKVKMPEVKKKKDAKHVADMVLAPALSKTERPAYTAHVIGHTALLYRRSEKPTLDLDAMVRSDPNDLLG